MSPNPRSLRLADQIQMEISDIVRNKLRDPRKGFITITAAEVADDLRSAKIFVSALGGPEDLKAAIDLLEHARGFIRTELGSRIKSRFVPELVFRGDDSAARGIRIDKLLEDIKAGRVPEEDQDQAAGSLDDEAHRAPGAPAAEPDREEHDVEGRERDADDDE